MKKIEIKSIFGSILFTYESENATIKDAVEKAVEENSDLSNANLRYADLRNANLRNANLSNANLRNADLRNADLRNADLRNADLRNAVKIPIYCKWSHGITNENLIHIGCEKRSIEDWDIFFASNETLSTERNTPEFKQIEAVYLAYKAYLTHLQK